MTHVIVLVQSGGGWCARVTGGRVLPADQVFELELPYPQTADPGVLRALLQRLNPGCLVVGAAAQFE